MENNSILIFDVCKIVRFRLGEDRFRMQKRIHSFRRPVIKLIKSRDLLHRRSLQRIHVLKAAHQSLLTFGSHARDLCQNRMNGILGMQSAMISDCKPVRFILNARDQMEPL